MKQRSVYTARVQAHRVYLWVYLGLAVLVSSLLQPCLGFAQASNAKRPYPADSFAVVEYFTSENCIRCKDIESTIKIVSDAATQKKLNIFLLSFHVDYLDDNSWKDRLATPAYSERHREYCKHFKMRQAAPGAVIINGTQFFKGEDSLAIQRAVVTELGKRPIAKIKADAAWDTDYQAVEVDFKIEGISHIRRPFLNAVVAVVEHEISQTVGGGPNRDFQFKHLNTVRAFEVVRISADGVGSTRVVPPADISRVDSSLIIFVQDPQNQKILGANRFSLAR